MKTSVFSSALWFAFLAALCAQETADLSTQYGKPAEGDDGTPVEDAYIWAGLVQATDKELTTEPSEKEVALSKRLKESSFNYRNFDLIGEHTQQILLDYETLVIPSDELYVKIDYNGEVKGGTNLQLQLWRRQDILLKTTVILRPGSPLFISGPKWGDDQLILALELKRSPEE